MAQLFAPPFYTAFDASGNPLAGAKLYFYVTATTTPLTVYQDNGLTTPHANPVVSDSAGRFAPIYLDDGHTYRVQLKTTGGTLIEDVDPISRTIADGDTFQQPIKQDSGLFDRGWDVTTRAAPSLTFPVLGFRPTTVDSNFAVDIMPNGSPSEFGGTGGGICWFDVCNADIRDQLSPGPVACAHVGIQSDRVQFGSTIFNGHAPVPVSIIVNNEDRWYFDTIAYQFAPFLDNLYDLGSTGQRVRSGYFGTSVVTSILTVATLPATPVAGMRAMVSDANSTTFNATATGGGSNIVPVFYNGSAWKIG